MKAMIFSAGFGKRLKPLTNSIPKALIPVGGRPMLEHVILKLKANGFTEIMVNVHHFSDQIVRFLRENNNFGVEIVVSDESDQLLDTGGGLLKGRDFFESSKEPFLVHNVDIFSDVDLINLYNIHLMNNCLATFLVSKRKSSRYLLFNKENRILGWLNDITKETRPKGIVITPENYTNYPFNGIHVASPEIFKWMDKKGFSGSFSIIDFYLSICNEVQLKGSVQNNIKYLDIGKRDTLLEAEHFLL